MNDVRCIELHGEQNNSKDEIFIQLSGSRSSIGKDLMVHNQESVLSLPELKQIPSQGNLDSSRVNEARQATLLNSQKMRIIEEIMENKRQKYEEIVRQDLQKIKILRISEETERQNMFRNPILKHEKPFVVRNVPEQFSKREFLRSAEKADNKHNSEKKKVNPWLYGRTVLGTFGDFKKNNQSASPVSKKPRMLHEIEIRNQKYNKEIISTNEDEKDKINPQKYYIQGQFTNYRQGHLNEIRQSVEKLMFLDRIQQFFEIMRIAIREKKGLNNLLRTISSLSMSSNRLLQKQKVIQSQRKKSYSKGKADVEFDNHPKE